MVDENKMRQSAVPRSSSSSLLRMFTFSRPCSATNTCALTVTVSTPVERYLAMRTFDNFIVCNAKVIMTTYFITFHRWLDFWRGTNREGVIQMDFRDYVSYPFKLTKESKRQRMIGWCSIIRKWSHCLTL